MKKKFPLNEDFLINAEVMDVKKRRQKKFKNLQYFLDRYPCLTPAAEESVDKLQQQFNKYQHASFSKQIMETKRIDSMWCQIGDLEDKDGEKCYADLAGVMLSLLSIFHSNSESVTANVCFYRAESEGGDTGPHGH